MKNNYQKIDKLSPKQKRLLLAKIPPVNFPLLDRELIYYQQAIAKKLRRGLAGASAAAPQRKPSKETGGIASRRGENAQAMNYLSTQIKTRNQQKLDELKTYLSKHESEIIDYERRQKAGKSIGSGRVEKAVDIVIGHRQKRKGMSWSSLGSKALGILKVVELNGQWQQLWFPQKAI